VVVVVVVDALGPPSGLDGVPCVAVGPKVAPDPWLRLPPHALSAGKEADLGRVRTVLPPARALSAGVRLSSPLVAPPPPPAAPLVVGALVAPRRSLPPGSRAAVWLQQQDSAMPA
jgi:hypothetical protein